MQFFDEVGGEKPIDKEENVGEKSKKASDFHVVFNNGWEEQRHGELRHFVDVIVVK